VYELAQQLVYKGHSVRVFTSDALDERNRIPGGERLVDGVQVHYFNNLNHRWAVRPKNRVLLPMGYMQALHQTLPMMDVVNVFGTRDYLSIGACLMARLLHVPYVISALGTLPRPTFGWKRIVAPLIDYLLIQPMLYNAAALLAQTEAEGEGYLGLKAPRGRITLVPLSVDLSRFVALPQRGTFRKKYQLKSNAKLVLFVGRIHHAKGLDILLRLLPGLRAEEPSVHLAVVGRDDGALSFNQDLARRLGIEEFVHFIGPLYQQDAIEAYTDADVFALTSRGWESSPLAALEACACGTQVVLTEQAGIPLVNSYGAGEVVLCKEPDIMGALRTALLETNIIERGQLARRMIFQSFGWDAILGQYETTYQQACIKT
jgi:glycosyltransferase involved in cell wall biosynthesis